LLFFCCVLVVGFDEEVLNVASYFPLNGSLLLTFMSQMSPD